MLLAAVLSVVAVGVSGWLEGQRGWERSFFPQHDGAWVPVDSVYVRAPSIEHLGEAIDRYFAFEWRATAYVRETTTYRLEVAGDDVVEVSVDGAVVARRDGERGMGTVSSTLELQRGDHAVVVRYEQFGGDRRMRLAWFAQQTERPANLELYRPGAARHVRVLLPWLPLAAMLALAAAVILARPDSKWLARAMFGLAVFHRLWLASGQPRMANRTAMHDDFLFAELASHLVRGEWLGPLNSLTLAKGPGYPLWIAANHFVPGSLRLAEEMLYVVACLAIVVALRPLVQVPLRLAIGVGLLWVPASVYAGKLRFVREGIYTSLTLLLVALALGYLCRLDRPIRIRLGWAAALGGILAALWITREEGPWLLPLVLLTFVAALYLDRQAGDRRILASGGDLTAAALPFAAVIGAVMALNLGHYGVAVVDDNTRSEINHAAGALSRIDPDRWMTHVIVRQSALRKAIEVSPTLATIAGPLEEESRLFAWKHRNLFPEHGPGSVGPGEPWPHQGEVTSGHFIWLLRETASQGGHYVDEATALAFFERVGEEIDAACAAGTLNCSAPRKAWFPPWRWEDAPAVGSAFLRGVGLLAAQSALPVAPSPSIANDAALRWFGDLSGDRLASPRGTVAAETDIWRLDALSLIVETWHLIYMLAVALGVVLLLRRRHNPFGDRRILFAVLAILGSVGARLVILAYFDARAMPSIHPLYLNPALPMAYLVTMLFLFCGASRHLDR